MRTQYHAYRAAGLLAAALWALLPQGAWCADTGDSTTIIAGELNLHAGVVVDAQGVLTRHLVRDPGGQLTRQRLAAARADLAPELKNFSKLRKVSLQRLEEAISKRQGALDDTMRYLAGLLRVRYVFYYPESKDIVLAGPAEGWMADPTGRIVGLTSRRPAIQLQDLVVALRSFSPGGHATSLIGCSIDPTPEGLSAMQQFLRQIGSRAVPSQTEYIVTGLRTSLGLQQIRINGISPRTNMARILVEADYRMKLIGIGLEIPPVKMASFVQLASPASVSRNALFRWYFVPDYQCVRVAEDGLAGELVGDGVKLIGEDELISQTGGRQQAGQGNRASQLFVTSFTKKYGELAERSPVYAELRNVIDLAVLAAFIQQQGYYQKSGWQMPIFGKEEAFSVETYQAPKMVESAVTAVWRGNRLTTPIGGGVHIEPRMALKSDNMLKDEAGQVAKLHQELKPNLKPGQWWWD